MKKFLATTQGLNIFSDYRPAKKDGKDVIWISIRPATKIKKWRGHEQLCYVHGADLAFTK